MRKLLLYLTFLFLISSCSKRTLTYFSNLEDQAIYTEIIKEGEQPTIQPDDILDITVSSLSPEANSLFNIGTMPNVNPTERSYQPQSTKTGFIVNNEGFIDYPVLGKIKLGGLTKEEAK